MTGGNINSEMPWWCKSYLLTGAVHLVNILLPCVTKYRQGSCEAAGIRFSPGQNKLLVFSAKHLKRSCEVTLSHFSLGEIKEEKLNTWKF